MTVSRDALTLFFTTVLQRGPGQARRMLGAEGFSFLFPTSIWSRGWKGRGKEKGRREWDRTGGQPEAWKLFMKLCVTGKLCVASLDKGA